MYMLINVPSKIGSKVKDQGTVIALGHILPHKEKRGSQVKLMYPKFSKEGQIPMGTKDMHDLSH